MNTVIRFILAASLATPALFWSAPVKAQLGRVHVSVGSYHHLSDLHPTLATRFDNALVFGAGMSCLVHPRLITRVVVEHTATRLGRQPVVVPEWWEEEDDSLWSAELHVLSVAPGVGLLRPYVGGGVGLRRFVVNSTVASGNVIGQPWSDPQIQPAVTAVAGFVIPITERLGLSGEIKGAFVRFRFSENPELSPEDRVNWQRELRPTLRLEAATW